MWDKEVLAKCDLERVGHTEHTFNLFVDASHDPQDVAQYLATQGCGAQAMAA